MVWVSYSLLDKSKSCYFHLIMNLILKLNFNNEFHPLLEESSCGSFLSTCLATGNDLETGRLEDTLATSWKRSFQQILLDSYNTTNQRLLTLQNYVSLQPKSMVSLSLLNPAFLSVGSCPHLYILILLNISGLSSSVLQAIIIFFSSPIISFSATRNRPIMSEFTPSQGNHILFS